MITCLCANGQDSTLAYALPLARQYYKKSPFNSMLQLCKPLQGDELKKFKLPGDLSDVCVQTVSMQPGQNYYLLYKNGSLTDSVLINRFRNADSSLFASRYVHESVNILTARSKGKNIFIIDQDNDDDFTNNVVISEAQLTGKMPEYYPIKNLEYFNRHSKKIDTISCHILPNLKGPRSYTTSSKAEDSHYLETKFKIDFFQGEVVIGPKIKLRIAIDNTDFFGSFDSSNTEIYVYPLEEQPVSHINRKYYSLRDTIPLPFSAGYLCFSQISDAGDTLYIKYLRPKKKLPGHDLGFAAIPISDKDVISNKSFDSRRLIGSRYLLLDFWGTWCAPCREIMPQLKKFQQTYGNQIEVVSVAYDYDIARVQKFIRNDHIRWINLFEKGGKVRSDFGIVSQYKVEAFPTLILVNKSGEIIFRDDGIRAITKLNKLAARVFARHYSGPTTK